MASEQTIRKKGMSGMEYRTPVLAPFMFSTFQVVCISELDIENGTSDLGDGEVNV